MADARLLRLGAVLTAMAGIAACGAASTSPIAPTGVTPGATTVGSWTGVFDVTTCTGNSCGTGTRPPERFALRLAGPTGVLLIGPAVSSTAVPMVLDVASAVGSTGIVVIGQGPVPAGAGAPQALEIRLELGALGDALSGTVRYVLTTPSGTTTKEGPILYGGRDMAVAASRFHGVWAGRVARTSCTGDCAYDPFLGSGAVQMWIAQSGATVTAMYNTQLHTLIGTANGAAISMSYRTETPTCRAGPDFDSTCLVDVSISAIADSLDRLSGTLTYHVEWVTYPTGRWSMTGTADLSRVARWP